MKAQMQKNKSPRLSWLMVCIFIMISLNGNTQSVPLPTDRGRLKIEKIADIRGGDSLYVVRTDTGTPLRGGSPWIEKKQVQLSSIREGFIRDQSIAGMNSIRLVWFEAWQQAAGYDAYTNFDNPDEVAHCLAMIEKYVNLCSKYGMYCIINFHSKFGAEYDITYAKQMWTVVAEYFKDRTHVAYETANEPSDNFNTWMGDAEMQKHVDIYNLVKNLAPNTMQFVLTPNRLPDSYPTAVNLADKLSSMTTIDWTNTVVGYHLYAGSLNGIRNLHKKYPALPTENNFPANSGANKDPWPGVSLDGDWYTSQTCEKFGLGWFHWAITNDCNCYEGWYANWPLMLQDALNKGWYWQKDTYTSFSEAETHFTIVNDAGDNGSIVIADEGGATCSGGLYVSIPDIDDEIKISIAVPFVGEYEVLIRVRSGNESNPSYYFTNNDYQISINGALVTPVAAEGSISAEIDVDSYYGTLKVSPFALEAGVNYVQIRALSTGQKVDYVRVIALADTDPPSVPLQLRTTNLTSTRAMLTWQAPPADQGVIGYQIFVDGVSKGITTNNSMIITGLLQKTAYNLTVKARDAAGNFSESSQVLNIVTPENIALIKAASASTAISAAYSAAKAVDGNTNTQWRSANNDTDPSIVVDLGAIYTINGVSLLWSTRYAKNYIIRSSTDSLTFTIRRSLAGQDGGYDDHANLNFTAQYIKIDIKGVSEAGLGVYLSELEIYGTFLSTATSEIENPDVNFKVFPNPANNQIFLENIPINSTTSIYTILGKLVYKGIIGKQSYHTIDVSNLEKGVYFIVNEKNQQRITRQIIIQ